MSAEATTTSPATPQAPSSASSPASSGVETASDAITNDVKVEDLGSTLKRLTITVPAETINEKIDASISTLATETTLPGFRKGRAPRKLLERRFGEAVRSETRNQLIADAYAQAIEELEIKPLGDPEPAEGVDLASLELEHGKPLTFSLNVEVMPNIELPELEGIDIKKPSLEITDELIEHELDRQRVRHGDMEEITGSFEPGDRLVGRAVVHKNAEDEPFFRNNEVVVAFPESESGEGQMLGLLIPKLDSMLKGKVVGDTVVIKTTGPENHEMEDVRGAELEISYEITSCYRITPATNEQLVATFSLPSEEILLEQVKLALEQRRDIEVGQAMRSQVYEHLNEVVQFDLPEKLSQNQVTRAIERARMEMLYRGMTEDEVEHHLAEIRAETADRAKARLKMMLVMNRLADHYQIEVNEQEINGRVAQIALERGVRPEKLRNEMHQNGQLQQIAVQIREEKAADRVVSHARVTELSVEDWNKHLGKKDATGSGKGAAAASKKTTKKKTQKKAASGKES